MKKEIEIAIQLIEWFKELLGYTNDKFLEYMNNNNVWSILNDTELLRGCIWAEEEDVIKLLGRYLSEDEQHKIISRYNS